MLAIMCPAEQLNRCFRNRFRLEQSTRRVHALLRDRAKISPHSSALAEKGISSTLLHTSHAFHSAMMEPAVGPFIEVMRGIQLKPPQLPYISNVTGEWITDEQATNPTYWGTTCAQRCCSTKACPVFINKRPQFPGSRAGPKPRHVGARARRRGDEFYRLWRMLRRAAQARRGLFCAPQLSFGSWAHR